MKLRTLLLLVPAAVFTLSCTSSDKENPDNITTPGFWVDLSNSNPQSSGMASSENENASSSVDVSSSEGGSSEAELTSSERATSSSSINASISSSLVATNSSSLVMNSSSSVVTPSSVVAASSALSPSVSSMGTSTSNSSSSVQTASSSSAQTTSSSSISATNKQVCAHSSTSASVGVLACASGLVTYPTVLIGTSWWMAKNLSWLPWVDPATVASATDPRFYVYGNVSNLVGDVIGTANYTQYGTLYNYQAALVACPSGWHLPSSTEWANLKAAVESDYVAGKAGLHLKSKTVWATIGLDSYSFGALPGGFFQDLGKTYFDVVKSARLWSSTYNSSDKAIAVALEEGSDDMTILEQKSKADGYNVRCLMD